jgi:hypothetical protein
VITEVVETAQLVILGACLYVGLAAGVVLLALLLIVFAVRGAVGRRAQRPRYVMCVGASQAQGISRDSRGAGTPERAARGRTAVRNYRSCA